MSERVFNQMSEIEPIILQLCCYVEGMDYNPEFPYMWFRGEKETVIRKALAQVKVVLEAK